MHNYHLHIQSNIGGYIFNEKLWTTFWKIILKGLDDFFFSFLFLKNVWRNQLDFSIFSAILSQSLRVRFALQLIMINVWNQIKSCYSCINLKFQLSTCIILSFRVTTIMYGKYDNDIILQKAFYYSFNSNYMQISCFYLLINSGEPLFKTWIETCFI